MFIDFLGTSAAASDWSVERLHQFVEVLIAIRNMQAAEAFDITHLDDGGVKINIQPEVSTFSDHIVISYPGTMSEDLQEPINELWTDIVLQDSIRVVAAIAEYALRFGLLIRGGLSYGQLYHSDGVVFGEAMVNAAHIEEKVASTPRVVVSERVIAKFLQSGDHPELIRQDADGHWYLNHYRKLRTALMDMVFDSPDALLKWKTDRLVLIDREIETCLACVDANIGAARAGKWRWFRDRFEETTADILSLLLGDLGPAVPCDAQASAKAQCYLSWG